MVKFHLKIGLHSAKNWLHSEIINGGNYFDNFFLFSFIDKIVMQCICQVQCSNLWIRGQGSLRMIIY